MTIKPKQLSKKLVEMLEALTPEKRKAIEELAAKQLLLDHMKRLQPQPQPSKMK